MINIMLINFKGVKKEWALYRNTWILSARNFIMILSHYYKLGSR